MNILVISNSIIVKELIKLVSEDYNYNIEYQNSAKDAKDINYCMVFVDDTVEDFNSQLEFIKSKLKGKTVLLSSRKIELNSNIDYIISKPFLPNDLKEVLDKCKEFSINEEATKKIETAILDPEEIARIKALMELDEQKESTETENDKSYILMLEDKESLALKSKKAKKLLYELASLGKKEFKNLLKGAKISIKIEYKKGGNE